MRACSLLGSLLGAGGGEQAGQAPSCCQGPSFQSGWGNRLRTQYSNSLASLNQAVTGFLGSRCFTLYLINCKCC